MKTSMTSTGMDSGKRLPKEALQLSTAKGFVEAYFRNLPNCETYEAAYEETERVYEEYYGKRRYSGFDSFRKVRDRIVSN